MTRPAWALATRLALWFALVSAAVFSGTGAFLYRSLERQLLERDDGDLVGKVEQLRHQLSGIGGGVQGVRAEREALLHNVYGHIGMLLQVRDPRGEILVTSDPSVELPAAPDALAVGEQPEAGRIGQWNDSRTIAAWAGLSSPPGAQVLVLLARDGSQRVALLSAYRRDLVNTVFGAAIAMALLGYAVARSALRPLRAVARTAGGITANRLGERLRVADAPAELADLVRAFNSMLKRLDESFGRLAQFSSDIAHDLRTPVANLFAGTQVALSRRRTTEEYEALLASHMEEYERINRMIDGMLFLARADNAQVGVRAQRLDAQAELSRVADYFAGLAEEAGVSIRVEAAGALEADPLLFRRAVSNLVSNALRFTPAGGTIRLCAFPRDGNFVVEVRNPGPGIAPEHLPHVFERFYRVDGARADSCSGSGLGLAIVKSVMILHGGGVEADSRPGRDTVFRLTYPGRPGSNGIDPRQPGLS